MNDIYLRFESLIGKDTLLRLSGANVAIFGLGGVGSYTAEALARCGIGTMHLVDADVIEPSNINRQLYALHSTIGRKKTDIACERILDINPDIKLIKHSIFYLPDTADKVDLASCDYVVDAIDTVTAKIELILRCHQLGVPVISSMGTGNKLDPSRLMISDIYKTRVCPLAKVMRKELKKRDIPSLKVVFSDEEPLDSGMGRIPGSCAFVPSVAGLMIASEVVKDILNEDFMVKSDL